MNDEEKEGAINQGKSLEILCLVCALIQTCHNISAHSTIYSWRLIWFHFWPNKIWLSFIWLSSFTWNLLGVQIGNSFQFLVKSDMWEIMLCYSRVVNFGSTRQKWEMTFLWLRWWCCWWCFHKGASTRRQIGDYFSNFKIPTSVYRERLCWKMFQDMDWNWRLRWSQLVIVTKKIQKQLWWWGGGCTRGQTTDQGKSNREIPGGNLKPKYRLKCRTCNARNLDSIEKNDKNYSSNVFNDCTYKMKVHASYVKDTYTVFTFHSWPFSHTMKIIPREPIKALVTSSDDNCLQHNIDLFNIKLGR